MPLAGLKGRPRVKKYENKLIEELAVELKAGLVRLRKGYVDAAESLLQMITPAGKYPYEFVIFRLTGYRPHRASLPAEPLSGKGLKSDLLKLMLDISGSFELRSSDYEEPVYDTAALAKRFNVSTKTIQRWRKRGLPTRSQVFPDGKRRLAFLESSVDYFTRSRRRQIQRSVRFSQMTDAEKADIIRRARRMASLTNCCLSDVAKRLAKRTGRVVETIRYTIRKHDIEHPEEAVFLSLSAPLKDQERLLIYRCFLRGVPVPILSHRYHRARGSIYRVINEMRARQLLDRPISYIYNPQFDLPNADEIILLGQAEAVTKPGPKKAKAKAKAPPDLPPYLRSLYDVPLLTPENERDLFRLYNYIKHKADKLRKQIDTNRIRTSQLKRIETLLLQANAVKNRIIRANLRLVVSIAKKHVSGPQTLFELISDGNLSLMKAVEKFDYFRGYRFSTYASWAIIRNFARSVPKERYQLDRFATGHDEVLDIAASLRSYDPNELNLPELRESIDAVFTHLTPRERTILTDHYGLDEHRQAKTLNQLSRSLGVSKERVRQIEIQALKKLRKILYPQKTELMI